jgi:protein-ribulosamine 3-kinase
VAISNQILEHIAQSLSIQITGTAPVGGGSINQTYCLWVENKKYFIKLNSKSQFPGMFKAEAEGLTRLAASAIRVPQVLLCDNAGDESFLLMEWIDARRPTARSSEELGRNLAQMHRDNNDYFGLDHDN